MLLFARSTTVHWNQNSARKAYSICSVRITSEVAVFLHAKGIDRDGGAPARGRAPQHPRARNIVDIQVLVLRACVPIDEVIAEVIGERGRGTAIGTTGDVAPAVVAAGIHLPGLVRTRGTSAVEAGQLVRLAGTIEVLLLAAIGFYSQPCCLWPQ